VVEPVRRGTENISPIGIRSPDRPAGSESLYRLSYLGVCLRVSNLRLSEYVNMLLVRARPSVLNRLHLCIYDTPLLDPALLKGLRISL
jgi:hypothetical protein